MLDSHTRASNRNIYNLGQGVLSVNTVSKKKVKSLKNWRKNGCVKSGKNRRKKEIKRRRGDVKER